MTHRDRKTVDFKILRQQAEQIITSRDTADVDDVDTDGQDLIRLIYELEVYQVELTLQNEELRHAAKNLEAARNEYFDLFDTAPVGFVTVDRNGLIERYNLAAAQMLDAGENSLVGRMFSSQIFRSYQAAYFSYLRDIAGPNTAAPCELQLVRTDGTRVEIRLQAVSKRNPADGFTHWRMALVDITDHKRNERELEHRANQLARLTSELTLAEQRERRRLAQLLHDDLQQLLAGSRLHLEMLGEEGKLDKHAAYRSAHDLLVKSIETARSLSAELSPPVLYQKGLVDALKWLARWMERTHRLEVVLDLGDHDPPIPEDLRVLVFQSIRELLFNVVKHAQTGTARVELQNRNGQIQIAVSDSGVGFSRDNRMKIDPSTDGGFGLFSIRERFGLLGGACEITGSAGVGTTVTLTAPVKPTPCVRPKSPGSR